MNKGKRDLKRHRPLSQEPLTQVMLPPESIGMYIMSLAWVKDSVLKIPFQFPRDGSIFTVVIKNKHYLQNPNMGSVMFK
jgi:hypothetical protein